jgi:hypothetical protein
MGSNITHLNQSDFTTPFFPIRHIRGLAFLQMAMMLSWPELGIVWPIAANRAFLFDVGHQHGQGLRDPRRQKGNILLCLAPKDD